MVVNYDKAARELVDSLGAYVNTFGPQSRADALSNAILYEHPTLTGQFMKNLAIGVIRHCLRDEKWKPFGIWSAEDNCPSTADGVILHPRHDGRWTCDFVIGCLLVSRQAFI